MEPNSFYAEQVNYWKSGKRSSEDWIDKALSELRSVGAVIKAVGNVQEEGGRAAFAIAFRLQDDDFQVRWPVLQSKTNDVKAARIQAATALYHDIKATCVRVRFLGARASFLPFLMLPSGVTAAEATSETLSQSLPLMITGAVPAPQRADCRA